MTSEKECLVGHLPVLAIVGFTELAIHAMVVLGFQAHPQFAIAETLQWCAQLELQRTLVNNFGAVRTLRDVVKMCWAVTFSNGVTNRVLMSEMPLLLGKGIRSLIWKIH
ncbi:hypothetical protein DEO72_LG7g951 [Vigna unguiculata]|uniref:Uncharacterized protein n=1 Tax=Vigna unguiculata TaxID=3917 RepID=A0A4D6MF82_VIGUN|nr:hypothetical protein DEO72_LG7g951 [Vigna unguiculata]